MLSSNRGNTIVFTQTLILPTKIGMLLRDAMKELLLLSQLGGSATYWNFTHKFGNF